MLTQIGAPYIPAGNTYTTSSTVYVGSLYEMEDSRTTKYVFLGSTRVAAVTGSEVDYYHSDHLGSANVISDSLGAARSLTEYDPFGKISRFERYGTKINTGWHGFNNKPLDDESGLLFYGGRYYDPKLGRFMTADTIVPYSSDPQSLNRYSYVRNNPVNLIDPTGHKWSWKKFWSSLVGAVVGVVTAVVLGPVAGAWVAGAIGGALGGAITGGIQGGVQGALQGVLMGGVLGGITGGIMGSLSKFGQGVFVGAMIIGGGAYAATTGNLDSFAGGMIGGFVGAKLGGAIVDAFHEQYANYKAGNGFKSDKDVLAARYEKALSFVEASKNDIIRIEMGARNLSDSNGNPSKFSIAKHKYIRWTEDGVERIWEMGPKDKFIQTRDTAQGPWFTAKTTNAAIGTQYTTEASMQVSLSALKQSIAIYDSFWATGNIRYSAFSYNSNYAVNSVIHGAKGNYSVDLGFAPGFPSSPR